MKLDNKDIITLAKKVAGAKSAASTFNFDGKDYSVGAANEALRDQFRLLASDYNAYRRNKNDIFEIMQEVVDTVLPVRILESYGVFAEVKTFAQGNKPAFIKKAGINRAKQFITRVGLAGVYEVFKLDRTSFEVETTAYGGAAQVGLEEFLDGNIDFSDLLDIIIVGLDDSVYKEIIKALEATYDTLQTANKGTGAINTLGINFDPLLSTVRAYGTPVIYTTLETASKLVPETAWLSNDMKNQMHNHGFLGMYKGVKVVALPQSFTDETNATKIVSDSFIYVIPETAGKPVKIALEGNSIIDEYGNKDRSREIQAYKKFGVAFLVDNDMAVFKLTS